LNSKTLAQTEGMPNDAPYDDVALIGGGVSGTMVTISLVEANPALHVLILEKAAQIGPGPAYATESLQHLLDVPAGGMGLFPQNPQSFYEWLVHHREKLGAGPTLTAESFVPRQWFGIHVSNMLAQVRDRASGLETVRAEVADLEVEKGFVRLFDAEGRSFLARHVVLALGNFPPGDPPLRNQTFHRGERYLTSPWEASTVQKISNGDPILVLGAGLTALDLLVSLSQERSCGPIHVLSRRGLFPQSHEDPPSKEPWNREREFPRTARAMLRLLRSDVKHAERRGVGWRNVIDSLRPHTQQVWQSFSILERKRFMRHLRPFWESHRHRVAPRVLAIKDALAERGHLTTHQRRIRSIVATTGGLDVSYFDPRQNREETIHAGFVMNCTGPECNYQKLKDPLIVNLFARGLAHLDPLFLGLMTGSHGALLNYLGQPSDRLFTLGSVQKGMLYETTAVPELRVQAKKLAAYLLGAGGGEGASPLHVDSARDESKIVIVSDRHPAAGAPALSGRCAHHPAHDDGVGARANRHRYSSRREHWHAILHRPRHGRGDWGDLQHRKLREALPRCDARGAQLCQGRFRHDHSRHEAASERGRLCDHLSQLHHPRRRNHDRGGEHNRRERLSDAQRAAQLTRRHQGSGPPGSRQKRPEIEEGHRGV
jgi:uncharacterized NAD(P)/FAD-binding protein YdhS